MSAATESRVAKEAPRTTKDKTIAELLKQILPAAGGSFVEWYEFAVYGFLEKSITENFFRGSSVGTWAGLAVTFLFRPIGGAFFGWLADSFGRKLAMQLTIVIMLAATIGQGVLPTFACCGEAGGWTGMLLLLLCRALQGLSAGGELSTAAVYISEVAAPEKLGFALSFISISGAFGAFAFASAVITLLETLISEADMFLWGWRLPFLFTIIPGVLLIFFRNSLHETEDFEAMIAEATHDQEELTVEEGAVVHAHDKQLSPIREVFTQHPLALIIGTLGTAGIGAYWYVPPFLGASLLQEVQPSVASSSVTASQIVAYVIPTVLAPLVGLLVDTAGAGRTYLLTLLACTASAAPLFYWWTHTSTSGALGALYGGEVIVGLVQALTSAVYLWVIELFPVRVRTTGVSLAYNLGIGVFGGLGPLISTALEDVIDAHGPMSAPAIFTTACSLLSLLTVILARVLGSRGILKQTHIRATPY